MPTTIKACALPVLFTAATIDFGVFSGHLYGQTQEIQDGVTLKLHRQRLEGTWRFRSRSVDGEHDGSRPYGLGKLVFKGNTFEQIEGKAVVMKGMYEIDPAKKPMTMDLTITEPKPVPAKVKQVYKIKGDTLWIATANEARPSDLKPGKGRRVTVYERQYTAEQVMQILALQVDEEHLKQLRVLMSFKEFLGILMESAEFKGKRLPMLVDLRAFKADDPAAASVYDAQIKFTDGPTRKSIGNILHAGLNMLPVGAPMLIRRGTVTEIVGRGEPAMIMVDGMVVITTRSAASKSGGR